MPAIASSLLPAQLISPLITFSIGLLLALCLGALWFYAYAIYSTIDWRRSRTPIDPQFHPPITLLKPLCGLDPGLDENLASFCLQDYPQYQIIFAVRDASDPSILTVQRLIQQFPDRDIQLVISDRAIGNNPKVSNLANAALHAQYDLWLIADSDIRVGRDYLQQIVQPLQDPAVGVVTCPYRSQATSRVAVLEALETATNLHPGIMVARQLEGMAFALGSTILIRQTVLEKIGGFAAIANYLADDFLLGYLPTIAGSRVMLSTYVVNHVLAASSLPSSLRRQIRWARGIRVSRPWGYLGLVITYGTIASLLLLLVTGGSTLGWTMLILVWAVRYSAGWIVGGWGLGDRSTQVYGWLMPLRDLLSGLIWIAGFVGNTIEWRGERFQLTSGGKLQPYE